MTTLVGTNREEILVKANVFDAVKAARAAHGGGSRSKIRAGQAGAEAAGAEAAGAEAPAYR
jgi:hypothetical protein